MSDMEVITDWEFYNPRKHAGQGGNYLFLSKAFGNAPIYAGEAGSFVSRFNDHRDKFASGMRTFMRQPFIVGATDQSHAGFAARWHEYTLQSADEQRRLVWVPTNFADQTMGVEGKAVWDSGLAIIVSLRDKKLACPVEGRTQVDIKAYYEGLLGHSINLKVPGTDSQLVGKSSTPGPVMTYAFDGGASCDAYSFYSKVETL